MSHSTVPSSIKVSPPPVELERAPLVENNRSLGWISDTVANVIEQKTPLWWKVLFAVSSTTAILVPVGLIYLITTGVGVWGLNNPVAWGWAIVNFVWWIGIGHAGTLISAIL